MPRTRNAHLGFDLCFSFIIWLVLIRIMQYDLTGNILLAFIIFVLHATCYLCYLMPTGSQQSTQSNNNRYTLDQVIASTNSSLKNTLHNELTPPWCDRLIPIGQWKKNTHTIYLAIKDSATITDKHLYGISIDCQEPIEWYEEEPKFIKATDRGIIFKSGVFEHIIPWQSANQ